MLYPPFYDPKKSYEENLASGPYGAFADGEIFENNGEPQYEFLGQKVFSPFGIPAGPLINGKFTKAALDKGFDIVIYKTVRSRQHASHPFPNVLSVDVQGDLVDSIGGKLVANGDFSKPLSITNSFGVPSADPTFWQKDIADLIRENKKGQMIIGSFQGTKNDEGDIKKYIDDFCLCARLLKEAGVKVMEVNFSCPNEGTTALLCYDVARSKEIAKAIKNEIKEIPLIVKTGYFEKIDELRDFIKEVGLIVQGIASINTISAEIVDKDGVQALPGEGRLRSGVCGHSIKWAGLDMTKKLKTLREELGLSYAIIGVGGVMSVEDFVEYRSAGADAVMSATGAMWNPYLAKEIKEYLKNNK